MKILDESGHRSYRWDQSAGDSQAEATGQFVALSAKGRMPFVARAYGESPGQLHGFDPMLAADLFWLRPISGG